MIAGPAGDELTLTAAGGAPLPEAGETADATVAFKDGRTSALGVTVAPPRPSVSLIQKSFRAEAPAGLVKIHLADKDLVPQGAVLTFSLRAEAPANFRGDERIEVAGPDGRSLATLSPSAGVIFADSQVAIATLDTAKAFNGSTAGSLALPRPAGRAPVELAALGDPRAPAAPWPRQVSTRPQETLRPRRVRPLPDRLPVEHACLPQPDPGSGGLHRRDPGRPPPRPPAASSTSSSTTTPPWSTS